MLHSTVTGAGIWNRGRTGTSAFLPCIFLRHILSLELSMFGRLLRTEWEYIPCHSTVVWGLPLIWNTTSWVALVAKLVERSPRLLSVEGLNPTQDNSLKRNSCPGWSWLVCCACACAFLPSGLYMLISEYSITESSSDQYCCLVSHAVCGYGSSRSLSSVITRKGVAATILHKVDTLEVIPDSLYTRTKV